MPDASKVLLLIIFLSGFAIGFGAYSSQHLEGSLC